MMQLAEQVVRDRAREQRRTGVLLLAVALVLAVSLGFVYRSDKRGDASDQKLDAAGKQAQTLQGQVEANGRIAQSAKAAADEANRRLKAAGKPTVPVPTVSPVAPPPLVITPDSPSVEEVRSIVALQLAGYKAPLTQAEITQIARVAAALVPKPEDGQPPTAAQVQGVVTATVAAYCAADRCKGAVGETGTQGNAGPRGEMGPEGIPGKDAPKITDEELMAAAAEAVAAYCAQDSQPCRGSQGPQGPQGEPGASITGPPGPTGRGIEDTDCQPDGTWLITYTDGTTDVARGPCRIGLPLTTDKTGN